ncbi:MAG: DNA polymerase III subunit delta' [Brevirhabdus sp.]
MSAEDDIPEADRAEGSPHPRDTAALFGQQAAEREFLDVFNSGRLHHGWLITGPRGVGKATLAWRIARFLLTTPTGDENGLFGAAPAPESLDVAPEHPVARRMAALAEPSLLLLRRAWDRDRKKLKSQITVDEVRKLRGFFGMTASDGGRRVVIVDDADVMNVSAANALLKLLEEPPERAIILLISHRPSGLLPTIRSRCRVLRCAPLAPADMARALDAAGVEPGAETDALAELAGGSVGGALRLLNEDGLSVYAGLVKLLGTLPSLDRGVAVKLAESAAQRGGEAKLDLLLSLMDLLLSRLARAGAGVPMAEAAPGEAALFARLCPGPDAARGWAELAQELSARAGHGRAVNLDPAAMILDMVFRIDQKAATLAA